MAGSQGFPQTNLPPTPQLALRAARAARDELLGQLSTANNTLNQLQAQAKETGLSTADAAAMQKRIANSNEQIAAIEKQLAVARAEVVRAAGVPGATVPDPFNQISNQDKEYFLGGLFMVVVLFPISIGIARRLWRRGAAAAAAIPKDLSERLGRLEQSMESVAIEVERIGEGQRFMTNVLVDSVSDRALGAGTMEAIPVKPREHAEQMRRE